MKKLFYRTAALLFCLLVFGCDEESASLTDPLYKNPDIVLNDIGRVVDVGGSYEGLTQYSITPVSSPENLFAIESSSAFEVGDCVVLRFTFKSLGLYAYKLSELIAWDFSNLEWHGAVAEKTGPGECG